MNGSYPYWEKELNTVAALVSNVVAAGRSDRRSLPTIPYA